ncbi:MAG: hypothetical protein U0271_23670 [Polyangiaceae bacterium]
MVHSLSLGGSRRAPLWAIAVFALAGCGDSGSSSDGGVHSYPESACSSCQEDYTTDQCSDWGGLAGCEVSAVDSPGSCSASFDGCHFENCDHLPICADDGAASCSSCDKSYTQAECDSLAATANCDSATLVDVTACGKAAKACDFLGCDFSPDCD